MRAHTHIAFGLFLFGLFCPVLEIVLEPKLIALVCLASIFPDIDHPRSFIGMLFYPISNFIYAKFGHRTITHSLSFFLGLSMPLIFLNWHCFIAVAIGILSHLIADGMNTTGIPLCWPSSKIFFFLPQKYLIPVGGKEEFLYFLLFSFFSILLLGISTFGWRNLLHTILPTFEGVIYEYSTLCDGPGQKNLCYIDANVCGEYCGPVQGLAVGIWNNKLLVRTSADYKMLEKGITLGARLSRGESVEIVTSLQKFYNEPFMLNLTEISAEKDTLLVTLRGELTGEFVCLGDPEEPVFSINKDQTKLVLNHILYSDFEQKECVGFVSNGWLEYKIRKLSNKNQNNAR
ncbi:MAG: metal-dependent hydrolase [Candidatus Nanoarchaeia archaeon]